MQYGVHVDDALMAGMRTDIAFTLFLDAPDTYDGGELVIESAAGDDAIKLPAGAMIVYPATTLHRVAMVTRGQRHVVAGWARSFVRDAAQREILFDLDTARRTIFARDGKSARIRSDLEIARQSVADVGRRLDQRIVPAHRQRSFALRRLDIDVDLDRLPLALGHHVAEVIEHMARFAVEMTVERQHAAVVDVGRPCQESAPSLQ